MLFPRTPRQMALPVPVFGMAPAAIPAPVLATLALVVAAGLWGTAFAAAKVVLGEMPPATVAVLRCGIAALVLLPLAWRGGARPVFGLQSVLLGAVSVVIFLTQNAGLQQTSAAHATLILGGGMPVLIAVFGACWLGERPTRRQGAGLACAVLGVAVVAVVSAGAGASGGAEAASSLRGDGLLALTAAAGAVYAVLGRRSFLAGNALGVLAGSMVWATLFLVPLGAIEWRWTAPAWPSAQAVLLLLYLGLCCSALAFALWAYALRRLSAAQGAVVGAVELPIGLAAAALLAGEALGPPLVLAGALVVAGVVLAIRRPAAASPPALSAPLARPARVAVPAAGSGRACPAALGSHRIVRTPSL